MMLMFGLATGMLRPVVNLARLPGQPGFVARATAPYAIALPPSSKPVCDMTSAELVKTLSLLNVGWRDCVRVRLSGLSGKTFLMTRKHELTQAGVSLGAATFMEELAEQINTKGASPPPPPPARTIMLPRPRPRVMSTADQRCTLPLPAGITIEGEKYTLRNPKEFESLLVRVGAHGLKNLKNGGPNAPVCCFNNLDMLTSGSEYDFVYAGSSTSVV